MKQNFDKHASYEIKVQETPYDYSSVMHYGKKAFTIDGSQTIYPIPDENQPLGNDKLSKLDLEELNDMYDCHRCKFIFQKMNSLVPRTSLCFFIRSCFYHVFKSWKSYKPICVLWIEVIQGNWKSHRALRTRLLENRWKFMEVIVMRRSFYFTFFKTVKTRITHIMRQTKINDKILFFVPILKLFCR